MITALMFSGGVDSILCLQDLVNQGETPYLFHFKMGKMKSKHNHNIRKVAKSLSPKSPFYIYASIKKGYSACYDQYYPYYYIRWRLHGRNKWFAPLVYADKVVIGYTRWIYFPDGNLVARRGNQRIFIDWCKNYDIPFLFPLASMKRQEIDKRFQELPEEMQKYAVSDTRYYDYGGDYVKS